MPKPNLIMGVWKDLPFNTLEHFLGSLRNSGYNGDICLFTFGVASEVTSRLRGLDVHLPDATPFLRSQMDIQSSRYFMYLDYLRRFQDVYENVMLSDIRDVIFQSDPFQKPLRHKMVLAAERNLIGHCHANSFWVQTAYPQQFEWIKNFQISCSGTSFGTVHGMIHYLEAMCAQIELHFEKGLIKGLDQGLHNYLLHMNLLGDCGLDLEESLVATMHHIPAASVSLHDGIQIDGKTPPVVHQWDRHSNLAAYVSKNPRYRLADFGLVA